MSVRVERDSLGEKEVPAEAYYGVETARAIENFPISGARAHPEMVRATIMVKRAAAEANVAVGGLQRRLGEAIVKAANEILEGKFQDQFVVDVFQAGAGTSHNMNANEVLANRANELLGGRKGDYKLVHPHDHVNMSQSTNDVYPTAMRIACLLLIEKLLPELKALQKALEVKAKEFDRVVKSGRTHLQDAAPIRLGQEFGAYASAIGDDTTRVERAAKALEELNIGGTAVGTGLNATQDYVRTVVERLRVITNLNLRVARNHVTITQFMSDFVELSSALRTIALDLTKIANDLRLTSSGPVTGLGEVTLPAVQPGSSIMPGKVNPVIAEALNMVAFEVIGNDLTVALAAQAGQLELNVMMPVIAYDLTHSLEILRGGIRAFTERLVKGILANERRCKELLEKSTGMALALNPYIGYDEAAKVAKESLATGKTLREIVRERGLLSENELQRILDPRALTRPGKKARQGLADSNSS